jgi:peptidoglycan/LPS O-acetylase OafA/YrhL
VLAVTGAAGLWVLLDGYFSGGGAFAGSLGYAMFMIQNHEYAWGYSLLNVLSLLAIVCALQRIGPARILETRLLVWIGKVSFGVYVYHLPLLLIGEAGMRAIGVAITGPIRPLFFACWVATVVVVSDASFRWLEAPFLRLKDYWRPAGSVRSALINAAAQPRDLS